ncbi:MAG: zf-HC2 domain-containing protein [Clostridia bacterium]|nr:zf-HC2 domain-containing protein [Clostridia bacterium]
MCYDEGMLLAYLDGEVEPKEEEAIKGHLVTCPKCRQTLAELKQNRAFTNDRLALYAQELSRQRTAGRNTGKGVSKIMSKYKKLVAAAAVAGLALSLSFEPVRAAAQDFLTLFRVEKVETVAIDLNQLNQMSRVFYEKSGQPGRVDIENFGTVSNNGKGFNKWVKLEEARKMADFELKTPQWLPFKPYPSDVHVSGAEEIYFKLKVKNINNLLAKMEAKTLLPEGLDGKTFTLVKPNLYSFNYQTNDPKDSRSVNIFQSRSPEIKVPADIDVLKLRQAILNLPMLPNELREQLASIEDWQNTLIIPDTKGETSKVTVNGVEGVMINHGGTGAVGINHTLIIQRDGVVTVMGGNLPKNDLLKIAESMR